MLNQKTINIVTPAAQKYTDSSVRFDVVPGTPMALLIKANRLPDLTPANEFDATTSIQEGANVMLDANGNRMKLDTPHDAEMERILQAYAPLIQQQIAFARTTVAPVVDTMASSVEKIVGDFGKKLVDDIELVIDLLPEPYANGIATLTERYLDPLFFNDQVRVKELIYTPKAISIRQDDPGMLIKIEQFSDEEIRELMTTGIPALDKSITEWVNRKLGIDSAILQKFMCNVFPTYGGAATYEEYESYKADYVLGTFLLADKLIENPPERITGLSKPTYETYVAGIRNAMANGLSSHISKAAQDVQSGVLITTYDEVERKIHLNKVVYDNWLATNNNKSVSNDVLLAVIVSGFSYYTTKDIADNLDSLLKVWQNYQAMRVTKNDADRAIAYRGAYFQVAYEQALAEAKEKFKDNMSSAEFYTFLSDQKKDITNFLSLLNLTTLESDVHDVCLSLLKRTRYPDHMAFDFLKDVEQKIKSKKYTDPRQAAAMSAFEYICRFVSSQLTAKSF